MDRLEEIKEIVRSFNEKKQQIKQEILKIETERNELAEQRNGKKVLIKENSNNYEQNLEIEINEIGTKIAELGNHSQELQNELDLEYIEVKKQIGIRLDNLIAEALRNIEKLQEEKNNAIELLGIVHDDIGNENTLNKKQCEDTIKFIETKIKDNEMEISELTRYKESVKKGEINLIIETTNTQKNDGDIINEIELEEIILPEVQPIEEVDLKEITIEEIVVEPIEEETIEIQNNEKVVPKTEINSYAEKVTLKNIIVKFEEGDLLYKAQLSDETEINIYPRKEQTGNLLLKDRENREQLKDILISYAVSQYKNFDKRVIKKIDPIICEILTRFAQKYEYDEQSLIYNYAMSFSKDAEIEIDELPIITYNVFYMEYTNLDKKEKEILAKFCKNARKNIQIDIIGYNTGFSKIRYILKRTFGNNNEKALPEAKY